MWSSLMDAVDISGVKMRVITWAHREESMEYPHVYMEQ